MQCLVRPRAAPGRRPSAAIGPRQAAPPRAAAGRLVSALVCLVASVSMAACGEPPHKEMNQAQGAIDAARAAGADRYAIDEYAAAGQRLRLSQDAAAAGDYRQALSYALESSQHAQNAARDAADARARIRSEAERTIAVLELRLAEADAMLKAAGARRLPRSTLDRAQQEIARVRQHVQEAGAAVDAGDYLAAQARLDGESQRIEQAIQGLGGTAGVQSPQRRE